MRAVRLEERRVLTHPAGSAWINYAAYRFRMQLEQPHAG